MKQNKVKGFTLVELIVVMATFSIIMFGAMQLITPTGKIFQSSYKTESISVAAQNIGNYFEESLRYADAVQVTADDITDGAGGIKDDVLSLFVKGAYDGVIYDTGSGMQYANGDLYVIEVDNTQGGFVKRWQYHYTAGDSTAPTTVDAVITPVAVPGANDYAINKAHYNEYHYNISLGIFELDSATGQLVRDDAYYDSFADTAYQGFNQNNFGLTITAYPHTVMSDGTVVTRTGTAGNYVYDPGYVFTASVGFTNFKINSNKRYVYKYNWITDPDDPSVTRLPTDDEFAAAVTPEDKVKYSKYTVTEKSNYFSCPITFSSDMHEGKELDKFYIIYSYAGGDIIK